MKNFFLLVVIVLFSITEIYSQVDNAPIDNLYLNLGAGFLVGDNGQPSSISNVAATWDINMGYWFGLSKYAGVRLGYSGDIIQSFNYAGKKSYGWNKLYFDCLLNISNLIYKTKSTRNDARWYCSPFISVGGLFPMAGNQHKTSFGLGLGIANEINVHKNISVTLDWRNTLVMIGGVKWQPEVNAGLKFYFTGKSRRTKKVINTIQQDTIVVHDCREQVDSIKELNSQIAILNARINSMESDTSIYHLEDKVIRDYVMYSCRLPYNDFSVPRAIKIFQMIKDENMKQDYEDNQNQLKTYYELSIQLLSILSARQNQLNSPTFNRNRWEKGLQNELTNFEKNKISRLYYLKDVIEKIRKESKKEKPDFSDYISELQDAINTKK